MLGVKGVGTQHSIKARIAELLGEEDCAKFYTLWRQNHMTQADVDLLHGLWKEVTSDPRYRELHHFHVLNVALQEMAERMHNGAYHDGVMKEIFEEMRRSSGEPVADDDVPPPPPT